MTSQSSRDIETNSAKGVRKIHISKGGAKPWTADDLKKFREVHPPGTTAHLWLTLLMMTGCRIGDARLLGRKHEIVRDGITWLEWQPGKKGSAPVSVPLPPPLLKASRAMTVQGDTYLLSEKGQPFGTVESLRQRVRRWCDAAGLTERSSHGIRKALAELLAEIGCSDHQTMSVLAHTNATTTAIYQGDEAPHPRARCDAGAGGPVMVMFPTPVFRGAGVPAKQG